jgi:hypothetical protein
VDGTLMSIVECDDATYAKQPVDIEKVHQDVIEGMPPIDECEVNFCSFAYELRECDLRFLFTKVYKGSEAGFKKIAKPYSLPAGRLSGIDQNVTFAANFGHRLADE